MKSQTTDSEKTPISILENDQRNQALNQIFGNIIRQRYLGPNPQSRILSTLVSDTRNMLPRWNSDFNEYISAIGDPDLGRQKAEEDLLSRAESCPQAEFDSYWGDFYTEVSAVNELKKHKKFKQFHPILPSEGKTYDYDAVDLIGESVAIEVKNARAPITIVDVFASEFVQYTEVARLRAVLTYYWDNTVTPEQSRQIKRFVKELSKRPSGYVGTLMLAQDVLVKVSLIEGKGDVIMTRGMGGTSPEPELNEAGLLKKISDKTEDAVRQLSTANSRRKILVINIDTPDGMIDGNLAQAVKGIVSEKSSGQIEPVLLLHHHLLEI